MTPALVLQFHAKGLALSLRGNELLVVSNQLMENGKLIELATDYF